MPYPYTHTTRSDGTILDETIYNSDHVNHITHQEPLSIDDYSADTAQMASQVDPSPAGAPSKAASIAGELERLRFALGSLYGGVWYKPSLTFAATAARRRLVTGSTAISAIETAIPLDTVIYGPPTMHNAGSFGLRAPITGIYRIGGQAMAGDPNTGSGAVKTFRIAIRKVGGVSGTKLSAVQEDSTSVVAVKGLTISTTVRLIAGDIVQLVALADGAGVLYIGQGYFPAMWMSLSGV